MVVLAALGYLSQAVLAVIALLSIASGLYYLAELVEEYTVVTKRVISHTIKAIVVLQIVLAACEEVSVGVAGAGVVAHVLYARLLKTFPFCSFTSLQFLASAVALGVHQYLVFVFFTSTWFATDQVVGYFTLCVWLVPFALFVSLCANDNVLPTHADLQGADAGKYSHKRHGNLLGSYPPSPLSGLLFFSLSLLAIVLLLALLLLVLFPFQPAVVCFCCVQRCSSFSGRSGTRCCPRRAISSSSPPARNNAPLCSHHRVPSLLLRWAKVGLM
eukprot:m.179333 g.179333  ORF g.179333 m.179333 type:complete len:272 (-) comp53420_c0_seq7:21-836(-)